jgi:hypothetical protein
MGKIVEKLGWKYLSIVYEESNYGIKVSCHFQSKISSAIGGGVCSDL